MADARISQLTLLPDPLATGDMIPVYDASNTAISYRFSPDAMVAYVEANATAFQAADADTLFADVSDRLTAGFSGAVYDCGAGSETINPDNGNFQKIQNSGSAMTITAPTTSEIATAETGATVVLHYANTAAAGAVSWVGFDANSPHGDTLPTAINEEALILIDVVRIGADIFATATVRALQ